MNYRSQIKIALLSVAVIICMALSWRHFAAQQDLPQKQAFFYVIFSGQNSRITRRAYHKITSRQAWLKLWYQHIGKTPVLDEYYNPDNVPEIDFKSCMVVAVFQGTGGNNAGVRPHSITRQDNSLRLRFLNRSFQTMGEAQKSTAYGIFVMPRSELEVVVEEDVHRQIGDPLLWKERARLR